MLDQPSTYKKYDPGDIAFGIEKLSEQVKSAWADTRHLSFSSVFQPPTSNIQQIVIVGMGGSSLGGHMIQTVGAGKLKVPLYLVRDYKLPNWVSAKTLVVAVSYSGSTAEVLEAVDQAKKAKAKIVVVAIGSKLKDYADKNKIPGYFFAPGELSKQPRFGLGFTFTGVLGMLERMRLIKINGKEIKEMCQAMGDVLDTCAVDIKEKENPAKTVARALHDRSILIVASEHLVGNAHALANQINETAKQFAIYLELPELNHHLLEGLTNPKDFFKKFTVLMLNSELYHQEVKKRYDLTAKIFEKQGAEVIEYNAGGGSCLQEAGEVLQFGSFVSYYLAMLNCVNPMNISFVDWFKREMGKRGKSL